MKLLKRSVLAALLTMSATATAAHEFWLDARISRAEPETSLELEFLVGQNLKGVSLPFVPDHVVQFFRLDDKLSPLGGRIGETPVATVPFDAAKGFSGFVEMAPRQVIHNDWNAFLTYLDTEGLAGISEKHLERGFPQTDFAETYARYAKIFIMGAGLPDVSSIVDAGARFEIVLREVLQQEDRPLTVAGVLMREGQPLPNHQVTMIVGGAELRRFMTNEKGRFEVSMHAAGRVLFNSVFMMEGMTPDVAWHSDWASLLFIAGEQMK